jgi:putative FmdB family regulatory protein
MPIYEYQCTECGFQKEVLQKISDEPLVICEECSQISMKKMVSAAAFRLKGGGWYETDFKSGDKKNVAGSGDKTDGAKKSADDKKSEAKTSSGSTTDTRKSEKKSSKKSKSPDS